MQKVAGLVARALRVAANRLDPEPPHMKEALQLLGWAYDGSHWKYVNSWSTTASSTNTNTSLPYVVVEWQMGEDEG